MGGIYGKMSSYCLSARPNNRCSKKSKKRQNCTTTHVSSLDTVEEQGGVVVPTFPLTTMPNSASESTFAFTTTTSALNRD